MAIHYRQQQTKNSINTLLNDNFYKESPKKKNSQKSVKFEEQESFGAGDDHDAFDVDF